MDKKILVSQLEKIISNIDKSRVNKNEFFTLDLEFLKYQVENQEYVVTVVGAMKSGKSSFTNALIAQDLMPNENQACTLTTTDILHHEHDYTITKAFVSGNNEIIKAENLSSAFHEDVRKSRSIEQKEFYTYKVKSPIYCLQKFPYLHDIDFLLMDTPGINEMEGLGVKKEAIEKVFVQALKRTDLLLFVLDVQYYKSEENFLIIEKIRRHRPDLLEDIVFILNKIDKLLNRDGNIKDIVSDVNELLNSWGIKDKNIYPVSARKALLGRLIEQGIDTTSLEGEINSFLPKKVIEVNGKFVTIQEPTSTGYPTLVEGSGILDFEQKLLEDTYLQLKQKLEKSTLDRLNDLSSRIDESLENRKVMIGETLSQLKKLQKEQEFRLQILTKLKSGLNGSKEKLSKILKGLDSKAIEMNKSDPIIPEISILSNQKSTYMYNSDLEAKQVGVSIFNTWFHSNTEPLFQKLLSRYQGFLEFDPTLNYLVSSILKDVDNLLTFSSNKLPDLKLPMLVKELHVQPQGLKEIPNVNWCYDFYQNLISTNSKTEEWEESFLIFFTQKKSKTSYLYDISTAYYKAKSFIQTKLKDIGIELHNDVIKKSLIDVSLMINDLVLQPLNEILNKIEQLLIENNTEIKNLDTKIVTFLNEDSEIQEIKGDLIFRTDLLTKRKIMRVEEKDCNLDLIISKVNSGTTIFLQEGSYRINKNHTITKSIAIIGLGKELTHLKVGSEANIKIKGNHGLLLEDMTIESSNPYKIIEGSCVELFIKNCKFISDNKGIAIQINGNTAGFILDSELSSFEEGIVLYDNSNLQIDNNSFIRNHTSIKVSDKAEVNIQNNKFHENVFGAILSFEAKGKIMGNTYSENAKGISVNRNAKFIIQSNQFNQNKTCAILLENSSNSKILENLFFENNVGVDIADGDKTSITKNIFKKNIVAGIIFGGKCYGSIQENEFSDNATAVIITGQGNVTMTHNQIYQSLSDGIICKKKAILNAFSNKITSNVNNGLLAEGESQIKLGNNEITYNNTGINILGQVNFNFETNRISENKEQGIVIQENAKGRIVQNICSKNQNGLYLSGRCSVFLKENTCEENIENGIVCLDKISGVIQNNSCQNNGAYGILIKNITLIIQKENKGKGPQERHSSWSYWVNEWRKFLSNLLAKFKKIGGNEI